MPVTFLSLSCHQLCMYDRAHQDPCSLMFKVNKGLKVTLRNRVRVCGESILKCLCFAIFLLYFSQKFCIDLGIISKWPALFLIIPLFTFTFTFMHLADAFIQSDLHCIQVTVATFYQLLLSLGIEPMILALLTPCSTSWATGKLFKKYIYLSCTVSFTTLLKVYVYTLLHDILHER